MGRPKRNAAAGFVYHVLNRGNERRVLFHTGADYAAFEQILAETRQRFPVHLLAWCLMPNHWHLVLQPMAHGCLSAFMHFLTSTHTRRWQVHREVRGSGHLYQGRFKAFLVQEDGHFLAVCRYVERNALAAGLAATAQAWRWSSLWKAERSSSTPPVADPWPLLRPRDWMRYVNEMPPASEISELKKSLDRGAPDGDSAWTERMADRLGSVRPRGRPPKKKVPGTFFG